VAQYQTFKPPAQPWEVITVDLIDPQFDSCTQPTQEYSPGDKVYLEPTNIKTNCPSKKLDDKNFRPFKIIKKIG